MQTNGNQMIAASNNKASIRGKFFGIDFRGTAVRHEVETTRGNAVAMLVELDSAITAFSTERKQIWIDERALSRGDHAIASIELTLGKV